jgi:predicted lysophospholipase L1 biosynthesis ABC-type transport system permease subunit
LLFSAYPAENRQLFLRIATNIACAIESIGESSIKKLFVTLEKSRTFANQNNYRSTTMQTAVNHSEMSAVDALWTLYWQQSREVRDAFRIRLAQSETGEPRILTSEEVKALTLQRGHEIKVGRAKLIAHETVMQEMEQMLATYAD